MSKKQLENPLINGLDEIMGTSETNLPSEKSAVRHQGTRGPKAGFKRVDVRRKVVSATLPVTSAWMYVVRLSAQHCQLTSTNGCVRRPRCLKNPSVRS